MGYSSKIYSIAADLIETPRTQGQRSPLSDFDDFVIALSIDSGLSMDTVRTHLINEMSEDGREFFSQRHLPNAK